MTMPRNFARSPISILIAIHDTAATSVRFSVVTTAPSADGLARLVERRRATQGRQAKRRDMIRQKIQVERFERSRADQPLGDRPAHAVVQALADHAERQGVQLPLVGIGTELPQDPLQAAQTWVESPRGSRHPKPRWDGASPAASAGAASRRDG